MFVWYRIWLVATNLVNLTRTVNYIIIRRAGGDPLTLRGSIRGLAEEYRHQIRLAPAGRSILLNPAQIASLEMSSVRFFLWRRD